MYCKKCGGKVDNYASHCPFCGEPLTTNDVTATYQTVPGKTVTEGKHKTFWGWVGVTLVTLIPLVGFIMACVWAFGKKSKTDLTFRNWAKLELLIRVLVIIAGVTCLIIYWPQTVEFFTGLFDKLKK